MFRTRANRRVTLIVDGSPTQTARLSLANRSNRHSMHWGAPVRGQHHRLGRLESSGFETARMPFS